jgi:hypothetical protein
VTAFQPSQGVTHAQTQDFPTGSGRALVGSLILGLGLGLSSAAVAQSDTDPSGAAQADPDLQIYATPSAKLVYSLHNDDFTVRVRRPGGPWRDLYEYNIKVDQDRPHDASLVQFDFRGTVEVAVQKNNGDFRGSRSGLGATPSRPR